jgi:hypothetical protein
VASQYREAMGLLSVEEPCDLSIHRNPGASGFRGTMGQLSVEEPWRSTVQRKHGATQYKETMRLFSTNGPSSFTVQRDFTGRAMELLRTKGPKAQHRGIMGLLSIQY